MPSLSDNKYIQVLHDLKTKVRQSRQSVIQTVNRQLLELYWPIGDIILLQGQSERSRTKTLDKPSRDLMEFPEMKGILSRRFRYMKDFARLCPVLLLPVEQLQDAEKNSVTLSQLVVAKIS